MCYYWIVVEQLVLASLSKLLYSIFKHDTWDETLSIVMPDLSVHEMRNYLEDVYMCSDMQSYRSINEILSIKSSLFIQNELQSTERMNERDIIDSAINGDILKEEIEERVLRPICTLKNGDSDIDFLPGESDSDIPHEVPSIKKKVKRKKRKEDKKSEGWQYFEPSAEKPGRWICKLCQKDLKEGIKNMMGHLKVVHTETFLKLNKKKSTIPQNNSEKAMHEYILEIPSDPSKVMCQICQKAITLGNIHRHLRNIHKIVEEGKAAPSWLCSYCGKIYGDKENRDHHEATVHTKDFAYTCSECGKGFTVLCRFTKHMEMHTGIKDFMCNNCGKQFFTKTLLKLHTQKCEADFQLFSHCIDAVRSLTCTKCNIKFSSYKKFKSHCLQSTTCTLLLQSKSFQCPECKKFFTTEKRLNIHMRVHTGETPFQCNLCFKKFKFQSRLNNHKCVN